MDAKTFYSSSRRVTRVTTLAEATELTITMEHPRNVVLLPPTAGDQSGLN